MVEDYVRDWTRPVDATAYPLPLLQKGKLQRHGGLEQRAQDPHAIFPSAIYILTKP